MNEIAYMDELIDELRTIASFGDLSRADTDKVLDELKKINEEFIPHIVAPRYIAMLDILGFKDMLAKNKLANVIGMYNHLEKKISLMTKWEVKHVIFSDTLVLYTEIPDPTFWSQEIVENPPIAAVHKLVEILAEIIARVMSGAINMGLPMRCGVAYGNCYIDPLRNIYIGQPFIDAHLTEDAQDWIGVALHPTCFHPFREYKVEGLFRRLIHWNIPVKEKYSKTIELKWTLNWMQGVHEAIQNELKREENKPYLHRWIELEKLFNYVKDTIPVPVPTPKKVFGQNELYAY